MNTRSSRLFAASCLIVSVASTEAVAQPMRTVNFSSTPAGAQVRLDAVDAPPLPGVTPLRRVPVRSGPHTLFFTLNGYLPGRLDINVTRNAESWTGVLTAAGSILVSCATEGAQLFLDNQPRGTFPMTDPLSGIAPGQHIVEVRANGMQTFSETVNVTAGQQTALRVALVPPPVQAPTTGSVRVVVLNPNGAVPPDVSITFDGAPLSGTPPTASNVSPGTHIVQVTARGFRAELLRDVNVTAGQTTNVPVELHAEQVAPTAGTVQVVVPFSPATVTLDGQPIAGPPFNREGVPAGAHELRIESPGRAPLIRAITVIAGQPLSVTPAATEFTELQRVGRLAVRANVPNAEIRVNDRVVGQGSYDNASVPAGDARITVSAPGYQPFSQTCTVSPEHPCDVSATLQSQPAILAINRTPPTLPAHVFIDGQDRGEIAPNMQVPPGHHRLELRAQGYRPYTQEIDAVAGQTTPINATLGRTQISTYGAMPLSAGDVAFDLATSIFDMPLDARGTIGLLRLGRLGVDAGFGLRTTFSWFEFQPRVRVAYQVTEFFSAGAEFRYYFATAPGKETGGSGATAQLNASFSRAPSSGAEFGAFTFTVHLGVEHNNDSFGPSRTPPNLTNGRAAPNDHTYFCEGRMDPNADPRDASGAYTPAYPTCVVSNTIRGFLGFAAELSVTQNLQLMLGFDYYLASPDEPPSPPPSVVAPFPNSNGARRALTASFWNTAAQAVPRLGLTFRF